MGAEDSERRAVSPMSPAGPLKVAITVDDMLLLRGWRHAPGRTAISAARAFVDALEKHKVKGVYQFSNTAPLQDDPQLYKAFDIWAEAGHHFGNHTHHHPSLNRMEADEYVREIETAEKFLDRYLGDAPMRCFRFCGDAWGDTQCKCDAVLKSLAGMNYRPIPVTVGFHDVEWSPAYRRAVRDGSAEDINWVRDAFVDSAEHELRLFAANARSVFGRDPVHIWLIHGSSIAADSLELILDRFKAANVEFVPLETAMADAVNVLVPPRVSPEFIFQIEKWAKTLDAPVSFPRSSILEEIETLHPEEGEMVADMMRAMQTSMIAHTGMKAPDVPTVA